MGSTYDAVLAYVRIADRMAAPKKKKSFALVPNTQRMYDSEY